MSPSQPQSWILQDTFTHLFYWITKMVCPGWATCRHTQPTVVAEHFVTGLSALRAGGLRAPPTGLGRGHILRAAWYVRRPHKQPVKVVHGLGTGRLSAVSVRTALVLRSYYDAAHLQLSCVWTRRVGITPGTRWWWMARSMTSTFSRVELSTLKAHHWLVSGLFFLSLGRQRTVSAASICSRLCCHR